MRPRTHARYSAVARLLIPWTDTQVRTLHKRQCYRQPYRSFLRRAPEPVTPDSIRGPDGCPRKRAIPGFLPSQE